MTKDNLTNYILLFQLVDLERKKFRKEVVMKFRQNLYFADEDEDLYGTIKKNSI